MQRDEVPCEASTVLQCNTVGTCNLNHPFAADSGMLATGEVIWVDGHITSGKKINTIVTTRIII